MAAVVVASDGIGDFGSELVVGSLTGVRDGSWSAVSGSYLKLPSCRTWILAVCTHCSGSWAAVAAECRHYFVWCNRFVCSQGTAAVESLDMG